MPDLLMRMIEAESRRQDAFVNLIASENYASDYIRSVVGNCFTNKYAEGYPGKRYYGGCAKADDLEYYCQRKWQEAFRTSYDVNVQPHSGTSANLAVYLALLEPGDTILSLSLKDGGHLSHGSPANLSGKLYHVVHYGLNDKEQIDYDDIREKIETYHPKLVIAGASSYSREIDFWTIRRMIDTADAPTPYFMADIAHIAGLVVADDHISPFGCADIVTTTTHKTLRGTRGGLIFSRRELTDKINSAVFPGMQGGPLLHVIAGKAATAEEACTDEFKQYIHRVVHNSRAMAEEFQRLGYRIVSGGTDNHMFLVDLTSTNVTGKQVQDALERRYISVNRNCIPNDPLSPALTSGIRIGAAAMTTKGSTAADFCLYAREIDRAIQSVSQNV